LKKLISASRRTELVAHYPDYLAERLERLDPEQVHTVVLWTKDPTNILAHARLREALRRVGQVFLQWTITGLGGTCLEPNVPPASAQLGLLDDIAWSVGSAKRIHWRFDPLVAAIRQSQRVTNLDHDLFRSMAEPMAKAGVPAVHTSFVCLYRKVARRLQETGLEFEDHPPAERQEFLSELEKLAGELEMRLMTCCEPGRPRQKCIDGELLMELHPSGEPCLTDRAKGQRELCGCTVSLDVGRYLPCPNQCVYCYAHPAK
jgi:DNA repair photolyase